MTTEMLIELGLTKSQAKAYLALIKHGFLTPPELGLKINESRSNAYKILERLAELGLAEENTTTKKTTYRASNPIALERLARQRRNQALNHEKQVQAALPTLLTFFNTYSEQPGVRFFQGKDGIKEIFKDILRTRETNHLIRSTSDVSFYDPAFFEKHRTERAQLGVETFALTPDVPSANHDPGIDKANLFNRTWLAAEAYTGQTEWNAYGDKLAIISYGEEAIGMIIESPLIAASFKQLFHLLRASHSQLA